MYDMRGLAAQVAARSQRYARGLVSWRDYQLWHKTKTPPAVQNPEKDPADWATGDEPMTRPQRSYLQTLSREAGEEFNDKLTKAEASRKIDELQQKTGRGKKET